MSASRKINVTKDYRLFRRSSENRKLNPKKHKRLLESMKKYGFLSCFPIVCFRDKDGRLIVKDGQHRLALAETLGLPVHWVEEAVDFDVAIINCTSRIWGLRDFAEKWAANGKTAYADGLQFAETNGLPIGTAFSLLAGTTTYSNIQEAFVEGKFRIRDLHWAESVAGLYVPLVDISPGLKNARFIEACMAVCRVKDFESNRLLQNAQRCRDKLVPYSTRDAYLDMLEEIYNFGRQKLMGLKIAATIAMRDRNAAVAKKAKKAAKELAAV